MPPAQAPGCWQLINNPLITFAYYCETKSVPAEYIYSGVWHKPSVGKPIPLMRIYRGKKISLIRGLLCFYAWILCAFLQAQVFEPGEDESLTVGGYLKTETGEVSQAAITLYENGNKLRTLYPNAAGRYELELSFQKEYEIEYRSEGNVSKRMLISTVTRNAADEYDLPPLNFNVQLPRKTGGPVDEAYAQPVSRLFIDEASGEYERDYKVEQAFKEVLKAKTAEQKTWEDEQKRLAQEQKKAEEEARKSEEDARRKAEEEARLAELAAKEKAREEERRKAEEEARSRAEEEARLKAEAEAAHRAEMERLQAKEAQRKAEMEARAAEEAEARRKAEEEAQRKAEEEARRKAEEAERLRRLEEERIAAVNARQKELEAQRAREAREARLKAEEEAVQRAREEARKKEEAQTLAREQAQKLAEAEARRQAEAEAREAEAAAARKREEERQQQQLRKQQEKAAREAEAAALWKRQREARLAAQTKTAQPDTQLFNYKRWKKYYAAIEKRKAHNRKAEKEFSLRREKELREEARLLKETRREEARKLREEEDQKQAAIERNRKMRITERNKEEQNYQGFYNRRQTAIQQAMKAKEQKRRARLAEQEARDLEAEQERIKALQAARKAANKVILSAYSSPNGKYVGYVNFNDGKGNIEVTEEEFRSLEKQYGTGTKK